ncbi:MAG: glutamate--cysteine ligase [Porticoccaceae bacterium]|nr:glutamate--cysteine ligase [Porticoccaceae bacterium]
MPDLKQALRILSASENLNLLTAIRRGIEKESLRVTPEGKLALTPHPRGLGSALTHPRITTDFSEALIELITPPATSIDTTLQTLADIHRVTYDNIGDELLWVNSMPCALGDDSSIPIARYGSSNVAKMKEVYRTGLGNRYGRLMQTIAGIHYNWSAPDECISLLQTACGNSDSFQTFKTNTYFGLIRNFRRHTWLLLYLFGAAPAVCKSFVRDREHQLVPLGDDNHTLHAPYATSLRMGNLGYQSSAQESLYVCYNDIDSYTQTLRAALATPYSAYEALGLKDADGNYVQLNTHLLQIENEFYSTVRPKRTTRSGETPLKALRERGIEYVEVRCIDLNPFVPAGIDREQADFLDIFLLYSLLTGSADIDREEYQEILENQLSTVYEGRKPGFTLQRRGQTVELRHWGSELLAAMAPVAALLDSAFATNRFSQCLATMQRRLDHSEETPSARILEELRQQKITFFQWGLAKSRQHKASIQACDVDAKTAAIYEEMAAQSLLDQAQIEAADTRTFEDYVAAYYAQHQY